MKIIETKQMKKSTERGVPTQVKARHRKGTVF